MTEFDFKSLVIDKSHEVPVLVDFWAPWCGPCRVLGPVVEELANEANGAWELVKVNTQDEQELARQYGIQSIPNVKLFFKGEIIGEFMGALPKSQIAKWLEAHLPSESKIALQEIMESLQHDPTAINRLETFVNEHPEFMEASLLLAQYKVLENTDLALSVIENIRPGNPLFDFAEDVRLIGQLATFESDDENQVAQKLKAAREAILAQDLDATLNFLIEGLMIDKTYQNDFPRRASIAVFRYLGEQHELTKKYRPRFSMALY